MSHPGYAWTVRPAPGSGWQWRIVRAGDGVACGEGRTATRAAAAALEGSDLDGLLEAGPRFPEPAGFIDSGVSA